MDHKLDLIAPAGYAEYNWFKDGVHIETNEKRKFNLNDAAGQKFTAANAGSYTVQLTDQNGCNSLASDPYMQQARPICLYQPLPPINR